MLFPVCCESAVPGDCLSVRFAMRLRAVRVGMFPVYGTCGRQNRQATSEIRPPRARPHEPRSRPGRGGSRTCADFENARRPDFGARLASARVAFVYLFGVAREFDRESCVSPDRRRATCNVRYIRFVAIAVGCQAWALALRRARGLRPCRTAGGGTQGPRPRLATCALPLGVFYLLTYLEIR